MLIKTVVAFIKNMRDKIIFLIDVDEKGCFIIIDIFESLDHLS